MTQITYPQRHLGIERLLNDHPAVTEAIVLSTPPATDSHFTAYVLASGLRGSVDLAELTSDSLAEWRMIFDEVYSDQQPIGDGLLNLSGWSDSYTGDPFGPEIMREWLDNTLGRLASLPLGDVLEIGCGAGMLVTQLAPKSHTYLATDLSDIALEVVRQQLRSLNLNNVQLLQCAADTLPDFPEGTFDTIVLNSVIQYFPSLPYLNNVLQRCIGWLRPNGRIYLGDLRNLRLQSAFWLVRSLSKGVHKATLNDIRRAARNGMDEESELLIDPFWFYTLQQVFPGLASVEIQLRRGQLISELTKYRYDVTLHFNNRYKTTMKPLPRSLPWAKGLTTFEDVRHHLAITSGPMLIAGVPNRRLFADLEFYKIAGGLEATTPVGDLQDLYRSSLYETDACLDPDLFWQLEKETSFRIMPTWSSKGNEFFDVACYPMPSDTIQTSDLLDSRGLMLENTANNPIEGKLRKNLVVELRRTIRTTFGSLRLDIVFVGSIPRTADGDIDCETLRAKAYAI